MKQISTLLAFCLLLHAISYSQVPNRYDVVIDEIMADPSPQVGLPANEWIELHNNSASSFNLAGWRIGDASGQSGPMPSYNLKPDSFVIVCTSSVLAAMQVFGPAITVTSFPSLDNGGDLLYLRSPQNKIIHALNYSDKWYGNELKKDGGWTLEMIDTQNPCTGAANWIASVDAKGGTPGKKNSVAAMNADKDAPVLLRAYASDSINIVLVFNETLDSLKSSAVANFSISDGIGTPISATVLPPLFDQVNCKLGSPLQANKIYTVTVANAADCAGNLVDAKTVARVGISSAADSFDIVVNEVLFNPRAGGVDYVEIYNRSKKIADLKSFYLANRNSTGVVSSITQLSKDSRLLFPGDYTLLTSDVSIVQRDYIVQDPTALLELSTMPSFNDDAGDVILLNAQGKIIDELQYSEKWHFKLIDNAEGVALERIDPEAPTQWADNWHSAATSAGYGTPGYKNSQYRVADELKGEITVSPEIVSPDNDGTDDYATISYSFPSPGYVANIIIFDAGGHVVRYLQQNALCGIKGSYRWDGLGEKAQPLTAGIYIIYADVFNTAGKKKQFKRVIVLARK